MSRTTLCIIAGALALFLLYFIPLPPPAAKASLSLPPPGVHGREPAAGAAPAVSQNDYLCKEVLNPFFAEAAAGSGVFKAQRSTASPEKFSMPKPAGVKRVFILGESVATILGQLNSVRFSGNDGAGLETINCGMSGYDSYRIYGILKEVLNYSPDLLVVLSGNNEGTPVRQCQGFAFELRRRKLRLLERYYSLRYNSQQARKKASLKMHAGMLGEMARAAKKAGVPVIFCTLPGNIKDMPSRMPAPLENELFASGYRLFYDKKYGAAAEKFSLGLRALPYDHFLNFYLAKALGKLGKPAEAAAYFLKADEYEEMSRAGAARNALVKRVAGAEGACVADLEALFNKLSAGGVPGFQEFRDGMHWRESYNKAVWAEISRAAGACGIKGYEKLKTADSAGWKETPREDALKRLNYALSWIRETDRYLNEASLAELSYVRQELPGLLGEAAVSPEALNGLLMRNLWSFGKGVQVKTLFPFCLAYFAETQRRAGDYRKALVLCDRALALLPANGALKLLRAQILAGLGRTREAELDFLGSSLRPETRALGRAYGFGMLSADDKPAPLQAAPPARNAAGGPGPKTAFDALVELCFSPARSKNREKALHACQSVIYTVNTGVKKKGEGELLGSDASYESYKLLKALGRPEEAREILLWTVKGAPAFWPKLPEARRLLADTSIPK